MVIFEMENVCRIFGFIHEFASCCYSSSLGGLMHQHKKRVGLLGINIGTGG